jgi:NAD(P)-dependent dehydrogenase (short-subunit alcohol dehydrogenase family)
MVPQRACTLGNTRPSSRKKLETIMKISGRTFLITGGSSGLGAACASELRGRGANIVVADIQASAGPDAGSSSEPGCRFIRTDVTDPASVQTAIDAAVATFSGLHGVVHCAGILGAARIVGKQGPHDLELFRRVVEVNLVGTFNVLRLAAAKMSQQTAEEDGERGVIVCTSSVAAFDGQIGQAAYSASKGGVASLTLPAARELARFGIRVVSIAPGVFETPMVAALSAEAQHSLGAQVPFPQRLGKPEEFAALACHIIENRMLNGAVVRLDGALRMAAQ